MAVGDHGADLLAPVGFEDGEVGIGEGISTDLPQVEFETAVGPGAGRAGER